MVSNPPYVGESEADQVQLEVRKYEPRNAVFAGATGLEVIERLIPQARESLKPGGWLVMEISGTIADDVRELLAGWNDVQITKDLQGIRTGGFGKNHVGPDAPRPGRASEARLVYRAGEKQQVPIRLLLVCTRSSLRAGSPLRFAPVGMTEIGDWVELQAARAR